jgi:hypothetical protein
MRVMHGEWSGERRRVEGVYGQQASSQLVDVGLGPGGPVKKLVRLL